MSIAATAMAVLGGVLGVINLGLRFRDRRKDKRASLVVFGDEKITCARSCPSRKKGRGVHIRLHALATTATILNELGMVSGRLWWLRRPSWMAWAQPETIPTQVAADKRSSILMELDPDAWNRFRGKSVRIRVRTANGTLYFSNPIQVPDEDI